MGARAALALAGCCALMPGPAAAQDSFGDSPAKPPAASPAPARQPSPQPAPRPPMQGDAADASTDPERRDDGVKPPQGLHGGAMHGPTPASIPGGRIITTKALLDLRKDASARPLVFDVLGGNEALPGALAAVPAHQAGSFDDAVQQQFGQYLQQVTQGRKDVPLVFYCQSTQCWMSYNASVRAIRMGYSQVLWYRGGIEAWKQAGQPVQTAQGR